MIQLNKRSLIHPEHWAELWECDFLEPVPVLGFANASTWRGAATGSNRAPGKNHPEAGSWFIEQYCPINGVCSDPMFGVGGLWLKAPQRKIGAIHGCEIESHLCELGQLNIRAPEFRNVMLECADALHWKPKEKADLVLFSPPFLQNHSAGVTAHQREIMERKSLHTMQEFGAHPGNLGRKKPAEFWQGIEQVYKNVSTYLQPSGHIVIILRNRILNGQETDEVGKHISVLRSIGLSVTGVHVRDLQRPTGYQAWKVARDPNIPWIRYEWAVVVRLNI